MSLDASKCLSELREILVFARKQGLSARLRELLEYLSSYGNPEDESKTICRLSRDWAPHSLRFAIEERQPDGSYRFWFNGGLVYHEAKSDGTGPLATVVGPMPKADWLIHT